MDCVGSFKCEVLGISLFECIEIIDFSVLIGLLLIVLVWLLWVVGYVVFWVGLISVLYWLYVWCVRVGMFCVWLVKLVMWKVLLLVFVFDRMWSVCGCCRGLVVLWFVVYWYVGIVCFVRLVVCVCFVWFFLLLVVLVGLYVWCVGWFCCDVKWWVVVYDCVWCLMDCWGCRLVVCCWVWNLVWWLVWSCLLLLLCCWDVLCWFVVWFYVS